MLRKESDEKLSCARELLSLKLKSAKPIWPEWKKKRKSEKRKNVWQELSLLIEIEEQLLRRTLLRSLLKARTSRATSLTLIMNQDFQQFRNQLTHQPLSRQIKLMHFHHAQLLMLVTMV